MWRTKTLVKIAKFSVLRLYEDVAEKFAISMKFTRSQIIILFQALAFSYII